MSCNATVRQIILILHFYCRDFSDCYEYDPFMSAKRQLEELCAPAHSTKPFFDESSTLLQKPIRSFNATKTKFRRTNSLRSSRKSVVLPSRPVFLSSHSYRPTVQRGLSDEGPISTSYIKTEEFDEIPVRSVCQNDFAITNITSRITKGDNGSSMRRGFSASVKHNLGLDLESGIPPEITSKKTAPFTVEEEFKPKPFESSLSVKDLKDKSNALSKQNSLSLENSYKNINNLYSVRLEPIELPPNDICSENTPTTSYLKVESLEISDSIDPKPININNKLSINATELYDTDITRHDSTYSLKKSTDTSNSGNRSLADGKNLKKRKILLNRNNFLFDATPDVNNISFETTNNISFETTDIILDSPKTPQLEDFDVHELFSSFGSDEKDLPIFKNCQEFLSSHLTKNKLLKSNSSFFVSCSNDTINIAKDKEDKLGQEFKYGDQQKEKGEIFICIETDQNENDFEHPAKDNPLADNPTTQFLDIVDNNFYKIEDEQVKKNNEKNLEADSYHSVHEENRNSDTTYKRYASLYLY